jgi:hypothetical protein
MIITVQNARVVNLYWRFLPYDFDAPAKLLNSVSGSEEAPVSATVQAGAIWRDPPEPGGGRAAYPTNPGSCPVGCKLLSRRLRFGLPR